MSRNPGIGGNAIENVLDTITTRFGSRFVLANGDVPDILVHGSNSYPIGRYLKEKVRKSYGFKEKVSPKGSVSYSPDGKLQELQKKKIEDQKAIHEKAKSIGKDPFKYEKEVKNQKLKNLEVKSKLLNNKGSTL